MLAKRITLALVGLVAWFACCALADGGGSNTPAAEIRELNQCKHIVLDRQLVDKSAAGRKAFKANKRAAYSACYECCRGLGWKYEYFTYKAAPYQCQCANKYRHAISAN